MTKPVTIKEIARKLGISPSTVSRALHDHPSIGLRTRINVHKLAKELNYEPNRLAISFKKGKTFTIGVVLPNLREEFFSNAISGVEDVAMENGYNVFIGQSHDNSDREKQIITAMKDQRVDGILVSLAKYTHDLELFEELKNFNIPVVFLDRVPESDHFNRVYYDMVEGTKEALDFLIAQGHRRIAIINGPEEMKSTKERIETYKQVMIRNKIKIDMQLVTSTDLTEKGTSAAIDRILLARPRPTAVLTMNDYIALDATHHAKKQKIKINKEISFVSYANLPISSYLLNPPMASLEQYPYTQGVKAAEILMNVINNPSEMERVKDIKIQGKLIVH